MRALRRASLLVPALAALAALTLATPAPATTTAPALVGPGTVLVGGFHVKVDGRVRLDMLTRNLAAATPKLQAWREAKLATGRFHGILPRGFTRPAGATTASTFWGARLYNPASAWTAADGATITTIYEYVFEEFPEGCRPGVTVWGYRNGQGWALNYSLTDPKLWDDTHILFELGQIDWTRNGNGYIATSTNLGLYHPNVQKWLFHEPDWVKAKGGTESTWHYHYGQSYADTVTC